VKKGGGKDNLARKRVQYSMGVLYVFVHSSNSNRVNHSNVSVTTKVNSVRPFNTKIEEHTLGKALQNQYRIVAVLDSLRGTFQYSTG